MRCRKSKNQHMKNGSQFLQSFFLHVQKIFALLLFFLPFFHVLNLGFSASDMGVIFAGPGLRVYNTFIVLNRARAKTAVSPQ